MRQDITAAVTAHGDLGREHEDAVAEGLVERIGAEIDKWVDTRLARTGKQQPALRSAERPAWFSLVMGLGSTTLGVLASTAVLNAGRTMGPDGSGKHVAASQVGIIVVIWIAIAVINVVYARRR